jgi:hypothetical protein
MKPETLDIDIDIEIFVNTQPGACIIKLITAVIYGFP